MVETALKKSSLESESVVSTSSSSDILCARGNDLYITWFGAIDNRTASVSHDTVHQRALFVCPSALDLSVDTIDESLLFIGDDWQQYCSRIDYLAGRRSWANLSAIAWTVDPKNCFEMVRPGTVLFISWQCNVIISMYYLGQQWSKELLVIKSSSAKAAKFQSLRKVVIYYSAVLHFFQRMTANRRLAIRIIPS